MLGAGNWGKTTHAWRWGSVVGCFTPYRKWNHICEIWGSAWVGSYRRSGSTSLLPAGGQDQRTMRNVREESRPRGTSGSWVDVITSLDELVPDLRGTVFEYQYEVLKWRLAFSGSLFWYTGMASSYCSRRSRCDCNKRGVWRFCDARLKRPFALDLSDSHFLSKSTPMASLTSPTYCTCSPC